MLYRDYLFQKPEKTPTLKIVYKWFKIIIYAFLILSMIWGCAQMFVNKYGVYQVQDLSGQQVYKPGVGFEILFNLLLGKEHYFYTDSSGTLHEYSYFAISTWGEAFTKTQSPFYGCFVYPIAWLLITFISSFGGQNNGAGVIGAIFLTSLIVRSITIVFGFKTQANQDKMQILQMKQSEIQAKYKGSKDPAAKQKQQMEIMGLYRKEGMSPFSAIGVMFLSIPFLFAMYTVIRSTRELKTTEIGKVSLIEQPWHMITTGHPIYLVILAVYLPLQIFSMFLPTILNLKSTKVVTTAQKKARKKQLIIQGVTTAVFFIVALSIATGVAIYWIFSAVIQILQTLFFHWYRVNKKRNSIAFKNLKVRVVNVFSRDTYNKQLKLQTASGLITTSATQNNAPNKKPPVKKTFDITKLNHKSVLVRKEQINQKKQADKLAKKANRLSAKKYWQQKWTQIKPWFLWKTWKTKIKAYKLRAKVAKKTAKANVKISDPHTQNKQKASGRVRLNKKPIARKINSSHKK